MSKNRPMPADHRQPNDDPDTSSRRWQPKTARDETEAEKRHLDEKLEEALIQTFPASDPIALTPHSEPVPAEGPRESRHTDRPGRATKTPRKR